MFLSRSLHPVSHGGSGDDELFGERGNDQVWGDDGNDAMFGDAAHVIRAVDSLGVWVSHR